MIIKCTGAIIYALKLDFDINEFQYQTLLGKLQGERLQKAQRFRKKEDSLRCIFAELLVKYSVYKFSGCGIEEVKIQTGLYGKPELIFPENVHFNLSHSGDWVVCAVDKNPVGIDIEKIQTVDMDIARYYFTKEEYNYIRLSPTIKEQRNRFYKIWTMKECYVKAIGEGLNKRIDSINVRFDHEDLPTIIDNNVKLKQNWTFKQYELDEGYIVTVSSINQIKRLNHLESVLFLNNHGGE